MERLEPWRFDDRDDPWRPAIPDPALARRRAHPARVALGPPPPRQTVRGAPLEPPFDPAHRLEVRDLREIGAVPPWPDHTGKGPRGWPTDARIHEEVCVGMLLHPDLDASELEVTCRDGEVTLTGWVGSRQEKRLAEWIADRTPGVRDVHNRLVVR